MPCLLNHGGGLQSKHTVNIKNGCDLQPLCTKLVNKKQSITYGQSAAIPASPSLLELGQVAVLAARKTHSAEVSTNIGPAIPGEVV